MRRYILYIAVAIAIPSIVFGSMVYERWAVGRRDRHVRATLATARQLDGIDIESAIARLTLEDGAPTLLFTGATRADLEPCGCFTGQSGGVARRGAAIERLREAGIDPVLVDLGGWFSDGDALDRLKVSTYLSALGSMGYTSAMPSASDTQAGGALLADLLRENGLHDPSVTAQFVTAGSSTVAILGATRSGRAIEDTVEQLQATVGDANAKADITVLLSSLAPSDESFIARTVRGIDLLIGSARSESETVGATLLVGATPLGAMLDFAQWRPDDGWATGSITMTEEMPDHPDQAALVAAFYQQVEDDPTTHGATKRLFASEPLENDPNNGYVGNAACQACHADEYSQWSLTAHAVAYETLVRKRRHFYAECVSCHVTGFGYESGFRIGDETRKPMAGVGCESCHGPGREHVSNPRPDTIRRETTDAACRQCHTPEHHPGFELVADHLRKTVDHSRAISDVRELIAERSQLPGKVEVELFVMSMCPWGTKAEESLIPILREFPEQVDFRLHFIATEVGEGVDTLSSLHGLAELEDIRQVVIAEHQPEALYDYLLCRAKDYQGSWEACAREVGIDTAKIARIARSEEAKALFRQNIQRTKAAGASASPTLFVDGRKVELGLVSQGAATGVCAP